MIKVFAGLVAAAFCSQIATVTVREDAISKAKSLQDYVPKIWKLCHQNGSWQCEKVELAKDAKRSRIIQIFIPDQRQIGNNPTKPKKKFEILMKKLPYVEDAFWPLSNDKANEQTFTKYNKVIQTDIKDKAHDELINRKTLRRDSNHKPRPKSPEKPQQVTD